MRRNDRLRKRKIRRDFVFIFGVKGVVGLKYLKFVFFFMVDLSEMVMSSFIKLILVILIKIKYLEF